MTSTVQPGFTAAAALLSVANAVEGLSPSFPSRPELASTYRIGWPPDGGVTGVTTLPGESDVDGPQAIPQTAIARTDKQAGESPVRNHVNLATARHGITPGGRKLARTTASRAAARGRRAKASNACRRAEADRARRASPA